MTASSFLFASGCLCLLVALHLVLSLVGALSFLVLAAWGARPALGRERGHFLFVLFVCLRARVSSVAVSMLLMLPSRLFGSLVAFFLVFSFPSGHKCIGHNSVRVSASAWITVVRFCCLRGLGLLGSWGG